MIRIQLQKLSIGTFRDCSALFSGDNRPFGWRDERKVNEGFGESQGNDGPVDGRVSIVLDNDLWDWCKGRDDEKNTHSPKAAPEDAGGSE